MQRLRLAAVIALAMAIVGCSGDTTSSDTTPLDSVESSTTEVAATPSAPDTTVGATEPATTVPAGPVFPLTGLPAEPSDPALSRPAMVVKIDNNADARPQSGLNTADIVFEEIVEVQTRFAAVFQSQGIDPVGPIRSGRTQDIDLLGSFDRPLLVWSGGNRNVTRAIDDSDLVSISAASNSSYRAAGFFRGTQHKKPHNLYAQSSLAWSLAPADAVAPPQQFQYLTDGEEAGGDPAIGVAGEMDGLSVEWTFDPETESYGRTNAGVVHLDETTGPITTSNIVVMSVQYRPSPADARSPEAQTIGSGDAMVFREGTMIMGTWTRTDRLSPIVLTDGAGDPILLTPGRTWIELARADTFTPVT
jgi:Protein of unknown function (DUF3048) N-terminal domain/Protein of unknown function (DUF3048) C-terminal domain